jgi:hypothetical protein
LQQTAAAAVVAAQGSNWKPLGPAQPVFHFDFNTPDPLTAFQPAEQQLHLSIDTPGVLNAVAFWFELQLDEQTSLSSSPYVAHTRPSTTWKQVSSAVLQLAWGSTRWCIGKGQAGKVPLHCCSRGSAACVPLLRLMWTVGSFSVSCLLPLLPSAPWSHFLSVQAVQLLPAHASAGQPC